MQTCYNCGKSVSDETLICPDCGALVRRYAPPAPQQTPSAQPNPIWQQAPAAAPPQGKVRLSGGIRAWLVVLSILAGYFCFSSLCVVYCLGNLDLFKQVIAEPGMEATAAMFNELLPMLEQMLPLLPFYAVLSGVLLCKLVVHIWLLRSGRRLPFLISAALSGVGLLAALLLGGGLASIIYFLDPALTWLLLRRFWPWMQK